MADSAAASAAPSGPSLEQILWRAMDRVRERPALVDSEEFADHIAGIFEGDLPCEAWIEKFFAGADKMHRAPADMAEAIVRSTGERMHVYEFELNRAEYVIVESEKQVVVVSDFGQFALQNDDRVARAISSAIIPSNAPERKDRRASDPKAYYVRRSGEVVQVDVKKVAGALQQLMVKQVSMPAVEKAAARLAPFKPVRRSLTEQREERALRQDPRTRQILPLPIALRKAAEKYRSKPEGTAPSAAAAKTALFVLMPDGQLARAEIGAANRWRQMVSSVNVASATEVTGAQHITIQAGNVVALVNRNGGTSSGSVGERTLQRGQDLAAVRTGAAPVRLLKHDELEKALAAGAQVVPGLQKGNRFWIQPEKAFKPADLSADAPGQQAVAGKQQQKQPLRLGEITGDPWADWALTGGGEMSPDAMMALRGRSRHAMRAALGRDTDAGDLSIPPELAARVRGAQTDELMLSGSAPVIGFRAADGSVVVARPSGAIRLAAIGRPEAGLLDPIDLQLPPSGGMTDLAPLTGAVPATALASLQMALEKTAAAGGYKLPSSMSITSAIDALDAGGAMNLDPEDPRRFGVRLAGSPVLGGSNGSTAQLVLSMPFPNGGEIHVGNDLSEALQAYLATPMVPAYSMSPGAAAGLGAMGGAMGGDLLVKVRGGQQALDSDGLPMDWPAMHQQAALKARDAVLTLDLPDVQPLIGSSSSSGLPVLLQRALAQSPGWMPAPGMQMPQAIRTFALSGPFDGLMQPQEATPLPAQAFRPPNPGEDEIVIPMPLWAQMGRGQLSETDQIMASPLASEGYQPPLGVYRLVVPEGGPVDMTGGAPSGTPGIVDLAGPMGLELVARKAGSPVVATSLGGFQSIGRVALDDGETAVTRRGRIRIGAPIGSMPGDGPAPGDAVVTDTSYGAPSDPVLAQGGVGADSAPAVVSNAPASSGDELASPAFSGGSYSGGASAAVGSTMVGALSSAMAMSNQVDSRTSVPARPGNIGQGGSATPASGSSSGSSSDFSARAQAAGQSSAAGSVPSPTSSSSSSPAVPSSSGSQTLVVAGVQGGSTGVQLGSSVASASQAAQSASSAASSTQRSLSQPDSSGSGPSPSPAFITGLRPGAWSGHDRNALGYQSWSYGSNGEVETSVGGVSLSSLSKPAYPTLPTALRFRYVGAPLWWSNNTPATGAIAGSETEGDSTPATRAMRSGLRAATSAAGIWRSILIASPQWGGGSVDDLTGGMDQGREDGAAEMSSLSRNFDLLTAGTLVSGGAVAGGTAGYIATSSSGSAGVVSGGATGKARADALEMSIIAAIPPRPPPLESSSSAGLDEPHARGKGGGAAKRAAKNENKEANDAVSHSKIEGSVDAIAQRIYHRIRRRIQSDRERFGG